MGKNRKNALWNFIDNLAGDKVVWMIVLLLILFSVVCIFSSTAMMTTSKLSRTDIIVDQVKVIVLGLVCILFCYLVIRDVKFYKRFAPWCFPLSLLALIFLLGHMKIGDAIQASHINNAWRVIKIGGMQVHVFEFIKVGMVLYLAWAIDTYEKKGFHLTDKLSEVNHLEWLAKPLTKRILFIYLPSVIVMLCIMKSSGSGGAFIGMVLFAMMLCSGLWYGKLKKIILCGLCLGILGGGVILLAGSFAPKEGAETVEAKEPGFFDRASTWASRIKGSGDAEERFMNARKGSSEYYDALDAFRQPYSAKIAIHEGGLFGKGPGQSTQRYVVPVMYEDYMYSFILEEYGLLGGVFVLILYLSLLARGSIIVRSCNDRFAQILVAGLVLLISGQAMMHIMVNAQLLPQTGQTLPMISHGATSFIAFSIAFGILLSISRMAKKRIDAEIRQAEPIMSLKPEMESSLDDLDAAEDDIIDNI